MIEPSTPIQVCLKCRDRENIRNIITRWGIEILEEELKFAIDKASVKNSKK
jgi:hypothetical protein